jgi:putative transposase
MPRRAVPLVADAYYHVYNRGHNGSAVFLEPENYEFFLRRLRQHMKGNATVVAYVLMPNHYHFLVQVQSDGFSHAMQNLTISYVKAINERYQRIGALFQGAFKAKLVERDEYLLHLSRYIHLNPVKAGLAQWPEDWAYSSYPEFVGLRSGTLPSPSIVLGQFDDNLEIARRRYREFVQSEIECPEMTPGLLIDG